MIFTLRKTSDWNFCETITIETLEDLQKLQEQFDEELVIDFRGHCYGDDKPTIEIYDDYRE